MENRDQKSVRTFLFSVSLVLIIVIGSFHLWKQINMSTRWELYKNNQYGFSIHYPGTILTERTFSCAIPTKENMVFDRSGVALDHTFPFTWHNEAGKTAHTISDFSVTLCVTEGNFETLADYYDNSVATNIQDLPAREIRLEAEGAGSILYYLPIDHQTTLTIGHHYIKANFDQRLSEEKEYIPLRKQEVLFKKIIETLELDHKKSETNE